MACPGSGRPYEPASGSGRACPPPGWVRRVDHPGTVLAACTSRPSTPPVQRARRLRGRSVSFRVRRDAVRPVPEVCGSEVWSAGKVRAYRHLAKLDVFDYYLGLLVVWSLLAPADRLGGTVLGFLVLFLLGEVFVVVAMVALDDLTGYRDGSDATNYGPDAPARKRARKPLVAGSLTETEVLRFAWLTAVVGGLLWTVAVLAAPHRPGWAV